MAGGFFFLSFSFFDFCFWTYFYEIELVDMIMEYVKVKFAHPSCREKYLKEFITVKIPNFLQLHEKFLERNGNNGHYIGNNISYVDLAAFDFFHRLRGNRPDLLCPRKFPCLTKMYSQISENERIKNYINSPRETPLSSDPSAAETFLAASRLAVMRGTEAALKLVSQIKTPEQSQGNPQTLYHEQKK